MGVNGLKISFLLIVLLASILTIAALLTPSWRYLDEQGFYNQGLLTNHGDKSLESFEKWVIAFLIMAILTEIAVLILAMLGFVKSSNSCVYCGLSALTFITDLFVLLSITVYGTNYKSDGSHGYHIDIPPPGDNSAPKVIEIYYSLGYSFSLAIVALITMAISTIIGMITAICIKRTSRRHI